MTELDDRVARSYHVQRQRRAAVTILVVFLGLAGAFYYASTYWSASAPKPAPCTTEVVPAPLTPEDVSLNVYNATERVGLATATSKAAVDRGFKVKSVANDPKNATIKQVAQIRYGPEGAASAKLLATYVKGAVLVNDKRKGDTIDLVLGNAWKAFGPVPVAKAATPTLRPCPTP